MLQPVSRAECPASDGTTYSTCDGRFFRIACGHRAFAPILVTATAASLQQCLNLCTQQTGRQSVLSAASGTECILQEGATAHTAADRNAAYHSVY